MGSWVIAERGFASMPAAISTNDCERLLNDISAAVCGGLRGGARLSVDAAPSIYAAALKSPMRAAASDILGQAAFPVRVLYFDKTEGANWKVTWHQDLTIAVRAHVAAQGFGPWSVKNGVAHVQPPVGVLERMVAIRLHLDDCGEGNGPLRVIPGTHTLGRLSPEQISVIRSREPEHLCTASRGDLLAIRPLLLHASSAATKPAHRRVLHVEYACEALPGGLEWFERCA
jgi:hypothetical protein